MTAVTEWARMGGYAAYVWPAYAVAVAVLGGMAVASLRRQRRTRRQLDALQARRRAEPGS